MKKILLLLFFFSVLQGNAQELKYGQFDFEFGFDIPLFSTTPKGEKHEITPGFYLEGRWQLNSKPIDLGFHTGIFVIGRKEGGYSETYQLVPIMMVCDQYGRGKKYNPYIGLGAGMAHTEYYGGDQINFMLSPRVGVRCFRFLNASLGYHVVTRKYNSRLYFNLGFYF